MFEKQAIFVFGTGRAGTSALARVLSLCGAALPEQLLGPNEGNPKGHWEPLEALRLNEDFLFRHGASWYDPTLRLQGDVIFNDDERAACVEKIRTFLETCPTGRPLILKEPRIVALSDFWFEAARQAGFELKIIIPVRHPEEVAASLAARDGISSELSNALWLKYNLLAERQSRGLPRVFVEYANLLSDWRKEIDRISGALSVGLAERDESAIEAFLSHDLYRQKRAGPPMEVFGQPWIGRVYAEFSSAAQDAPLDPAVLDEIFSAYRACERTFRISTNEFRNQWNGSVWASDLTAFLSQVQAECAIEIARRFGDTVELGGAGVDGKQKEFARQADRVSSVLTELAAHEKQRDHDQRRIGELDLLTTTLTAELQHQRDLEQRRIGELDLVNTTLTVELEHQRDHEQRRIGEIDLVVATLTAELQHARSHAEAVRSQFLEANATLAAAQAELTASREKAKAYATTEERLERKAQQLEDDLEGQKRALRDREEHFTQELTSLQAQLTNVQAELTNLQAQLNSSQAQLDASWTDATRLRALIPALQTQVDTYERSRSWRWTAPFRAARRHLGRKG